MKTTTNLAVLLVLILVAAAGYSQQDIDPGVSAAGFFSAGWQEFSDTRFLLNALLTLGLSACLGAIIAYHPRNLESTHTLLDINAPKAYIMCAVIGAIIGILVVKYGQVVGFVVFGIGGLLRFRTIMGSAALTGNVIFATLIGLSCGLNLPHVAVLATFFGYVLIYLLHMRLTYSIDIKGIPAEKIPEAAVAYRSLLKKLGCRIFSEKKKLAKQEMTLIFSCSRRLSQDQLEALLDSEIAPALKGTIDWELE